MAATGGPLKEMTYRGRTFRGTDDSVLVINSLGGYTIEHMGNGDGSTRRKKTPVPWHVSGVKIEIDHSNRDYQFIKDNVTSSEDDGDVTFTLTDGTIYAGTGDFDGEIPNDTSDASLDAEMKGGGELTKL